MMRKDVKYSESRIAGLCLDGQVLVTVTSRRTLITHILILRAYLFFKTWPERSTQQTLGGAAITTAMQKALGQWLSTDLAPGPTFPPLATKSQPKFFKLWTSLTKFADRVGWQ